MNYDELVRKGSDTAKGGFRNEDDIVRKFNNWKDDVEAKKWLIIMKYDLDEIEYVKAEKVPSGHKSDVQVQVTIKLKSAISVENLQVKLVTINSGFNQIDKRWVDKYKDLWDIPKDIVILLKLYTGEIEPSVKTIDPRRMTMLEFSTKDREKILSFFMQNKSLIINDVLKGRGRFSAEWMLVAQKVFSSARWVLKPINFVINHYGNGEVTFGKRGTIHVGRITVQRKGGDGGRPTANMLQFKIDPTELFNV